MTVFVDYVGRRAPGRNYNGPKGLAPIIGIIGALRVLPGTSRNDLAELTINGVRAAWFPMLGAGRYVARAVAACSGSCRSTPTTGHGWLLSGYRSGRRV